ncbi:lycopene cyclase domain-containing protein [Sanguibacter sp. A247]|uniref:lycopene cyclase domain-containing protein n=1 Tax=unclassified Sanguibacter TaxID=2645534 RepID=UPI003FD87CAC
MNGTYLLALLGSAAGVAAIDVRWKLLLAAPARGGALPGRWRAAAALATGAVLLLVWDLVAISEGFYGLGHGDALLGIEVAPHLPVEELVFIVFLPYVTLVTAAATLRILGARRASPSAGAPE